jgi:hypothetical protein
MIFSHGLKVFGAILSLMLLASSKPTLGRRVTNQTVPHLTNLSAADVPIPPPLSKDEIHANVMAKWPTDKIITSAQLSQLREDAASDSKLTNTTLYLSDLRKWVKLGGTSDNTTVTRRDQLGIRQACPCQGETYYDVLWTYAYWGPWEHLTSCMVVAGDPAGGTVTYTEETSISVSYGGK